MQEADETLADGLKVLAQFNRIQRERAAKPTTDSIDYEEDKSSTKFEQYRQPMTARTGDNAESSTLDVENMALTEAGKQPRTPMADLDAGYNTAPPPNT